MLRHRIEENNSNTLLILFSGYGNEIKDESQFEWNKITSDLLASRIFFMDTEMDWYHKHIDEVRSILKPLSQDKRLIMMGVSMGGYAALLFANLFNGESISFGPQTNINKSVDYDMRWFGRISKINEWTSYKDYLDLSFISGKQHHIYFGMNNKPDAAHAQRLNVCLHPQKFEGHAIAQWMKKNNLLKKVIEERINASRCN